MDNVNRGMTAMLIAIGITATGCAWRTVEAGCANVPNPVLLSRVDRVKGHQAAETAALGKVDVEVAETQTVTVGQQGNYQVTTVNTEREGANKASFAVMTATQGKKDVDIHVARVPAGAYVLAPLFFVRSKSWVGLEGTAESAGAR